MFAVETQDTFDNQFIMEDSFQFDQSSSLIQLDDFRPLDRQENSANNIISAYSTRGGKSFNQDQYDFIQGQQFILAAVYDGHGDRTVALHLKEKLLNNIVAHKLFHINPLQSIIQCLEKVEEHILQNYSNQSGSTALITLSNKNGILVVNIGDSLCYGFRENKKSKASIQIEEDCQIKSVNQLKQKFLLNSIHDLNNESQKSRVYARGGSIYKNRIFGELNITRSIGDKMYKQWLTSIPQVRFYSSEMGIKQIILCSDGAKQLCQLEKTPKDMLNSLKQNRLIFNDNTTLLHYRNNFY